MTREQREQIGALLEIIGSRERTFTEAHEAEKAILAAFDALTAERDASARDAEWWRALLVKWMQGENEKDGGRTIVFTLEESLALSAAARAATREEGR